MGETFDETEHTEVATAGERLRAAREAKGLTLEDIAAQTRIPRRHLESLENSDWVNLPAPTYTTGFAKSYASAVGLDRVEIGERLREEIGGHRPAPATAVVFEPADPARTMPKWLVFGAIAAVLLLVLVMSWLNDQSFRPLDDSANDNAATAVAPEAAAPVQAPPAVVAGAGAVAIIATAPVWIQVYEKGGSRLFEGVLAAGQRFDVPATATAPLLRTAKAEALRITVGTNDAPPVGPAGTTLRDISLLGPDLMRGPAAAAPAPPAATPRAVPAPRPRRSQRTPSAPAQTAPAAAETPPAPAVANTTG
ncbi:MAG: helix-turn-helix domain-containing protein [Sphingomicrobium sp.]